MGDAARRWALDRGLSAAGSPEAAKQVPCSLGNLTIPCHHIDVPILATIKGSTLNTMHMMIDGRG